MLNPSLRLKGKLRETSLCGIGETLRLFVEMLPFSQHDMERPLIAMPGIALLRIVSEQ
jgi:hypothetical protein